MATEYPGNVIPAPGYRVGNEVVDDELLYSTHAFTQKGATLKQSQGTLLLGTPMSYEVSTKTWIKDLVAPTGILRQTVATGTDAAARFQGNIVIRGILKRGKVAVACGLAATDPITVTTVSALNGREDTTYDTFIF